jgi:hypothetical protein
VTAAKDWLTENFDAETIVEAAEKKVEVELTPEQVRSCPPGYRRTSVHAGSDCFWVA